MTGLVDRLEGVAAAGAVFLGRAAGLLLAATVLLILAEILLRGVAGRSLGAAHELSGYALALIAAWGFAPALLTGRRSPPAADPAAEADPERGGADPMSGEHVRITVAVDRLPVRLRAAADLLGALAMALVAALMARRGVELAVDSLSRGATANTPLGTPLWLPQALWAAGLAWFAATAAVLALRAALGALRPAPAGSAAPRPAEAER